LPSTTFRGFVLLAAASSSMPSWWRFAAAEYDGVEYTETMTEHNGPVLAREYGYLAVSFHEQVLVDATTSTHGHGGNRFDFYVWGQNASGRGGWIPDAFATIVAPVPVGHEGHPDIVADAVVPGDDVEAEVAQDEPHDAWSDFYEV
jgi:hypothetical protein